MAVCPKCNEKIDYLTLRGNRPQEYHFGVADGKIALEPVEEADFLDDRIWYCPECGEELYAQYMSPDAEEDAKKFLQGVKDGNLSKV